MTSDKIKLADLYLPRIEAALTGASEMARPRAVVFRRPAEWIHKYDFFVASFVEVDLARDFCSMMQSSEYKWTICTLYPQTHDYALGTVEVWLGGQVVEKH